MDLHFVGGCSTGEDALSAICAGDPHIALLEPNLSGEREPTLIQQLVEAGAPSTRVLILAADGCGAAVYRSLALGAWGYLGKAFMDFDSLETAVIEVAGGRTVVSPELMQSIAVEIRDRANEVKLHFTDRERLILTLVSRGCSSPEIARQLFLSKSTVKSHLHTAYEKLGVSDRAAAVAEAIRRGLVETS